LWLFKGFIGLYAIAFLLYLIGTFGWFGSEKDPLAGVFLVILGMPWTALVDCLRESLRTPPAFLTPAVNAALIYSVCRLVGRIGGTGA
jgi:hypothetical protein